MTYPRRLIWVRLLPVMLLLPGCSFLNDALWPSLVGEQPAAAEPTPANNVPGNSTENAGTEDATAVDLQQNLDVAERTLIGLAGRVDLHEDLFQRRQDALVQMSQEFDFADDAPLSSEAWLDAQLHVSRLSATLVEFNTVRSALAEDTARAAAQFSSLREWLKIPGLDPDQQARLSQLNEAAIDLVSRLGDIDTNMEADFARYDAFVSATTHRIEAARPSELDLTPPDKRAKPSAAPIETADPTPDGPAQSGDRFAGRKPLAVLRYPDATTDPTPELRALMDKVKAQYPDIAFDVETLAAPDSGVEAVLALLQELQVDSTVFNGLLGEGETPAIKLYPR